MRAAGRFAVAAACLVAVGVAPGEDDIHQAARQAAERQLKACGRAYVARIDFQRHLVYISALDDEHFGQTADLLAAFADAHRRTLLDQPLPWNLTIILPTVEDYARLTDESTFAGMYYPAAHKIISLDRGRILLHEFTHALHHADTSPARQEHPTWVSEGLATLFQSCRISPSGLEPVVDASVLTFQKAIRTKTAVPLADLMAMGQKRFLEKADLCYAQARYALFWLYEKGQLKQWYQRYKATYADDPSGLRAFEWAAGNRLFVIEDEWHRWVAGLKLPLGELRAGQGRLGAEVEDHPQGVRVVSLVEGSAAKQAGRLQVGDVITVFNGVTVDNPATLVAAVRAAGAQQTVTIELIRHGRKTTIRQPLGGGD